MRQPPDELMLFAAGFGSRMQPLTVDLPKPLILVAEESLLDRTLTLATAGGITKTVVNTHYLGDKIAKHLENYPAQVVHEPNILDTGGGLKNASKFFNGPVIFTSNSDAIWSGPNPFSYLFQNWRDDCDALLLCAPISQVSGLPEHQLWLNPGAVRASGHAVRDLRDHRLHRQHGRAPRRPREGARGSHRTASLNSNSAISPFH